MLTLKNPSFPWDRWTAPRFSLMFVCLYSRKSLLAERLLVSRSLDRPVADDECRTTSGSTDSGQACRLAIPIQAVAQSKIAQKLLVDALRQFPDNLPGVSFRGEAL